MNARAPLHLSLALLAVLAIVVATVAGAPPAAAGAGARAAPAAWSHPLRAGPWGVAADHAGAVVVTDAPGVEALDREGHRRWSARVDGLVEATPALGGGRVLVGGRGRVTELSRSTGTMGWQREMAGDVTSLALAGDTAVVGDHSGLLAAFDAGTGEPRWPVRFEGRVWSAARIDPAKGAVVATWHEGPRPAARVFDLATGALRWETPTAVMTAAPVLQGDTVVLAIGDGNRHARVEAHDLLTGARAWSTAVPGSFEESIEPAADDRDVVVVDHFGVVTALDLATGALRWRHDLGYALLDTQMPLTRRRVVFRSFSGDVFVLDRRDGHLVTRYPPRRLGGYVIATVRPPWPGPAALLVAVRAEALRVDLLPLG
jgi:outer membrane protein assembly factor BamB